MLHSHPDYAFGAPLPSFFFMQRVLALCRSLKDT
jgi:hypothetical protein